MKKRLLNGPMMTYLFLLAGGYIYMMYFQILQQDFRCDRGYSKLSGQITSRERKLWSSGEKGQPASLKARFGWPSRLSLASLISLAQPASQAQPGQPQGLASLALGPSLGGLRFLFELKFVPSEVTSGKQWVQLCLSRSLRFGLSLLVGLLILGCRPTGYIIYPPSL